MIEQTALEIGQKIKKKEISVKEAAEEYLVQLRKSEPQIHAYVTETNEITEHALEIQKGIADGKYLSPLAGVPAAIKDNMCTSGTRTTCGSKMLEHFVPAYDAQAVENLKQAGALIIGKTNMDEFAMGSTTETSYFGTTQNPWNLSRVPGGSSGGSAAAVAAGSAAYALGSDTGGSIRQPSSFCGVVGLKPTYGTVSRYGLIAYGSSLDQIGPIAKDVADCAAILTAVASYDGKDSTSVKREELDFTEALTTDVKGMKIGVPEEYLEAGLQQEIREAVIKTASMFEQAGAEVGYFKLGMTDYVVPAYYTIASAEASSNLSRFDGVKYGFRAVGYDGLHEMYKQTRSEGFGAEVKRRITLGSFVLSSGYYDAYYIKALKTKSLIKKAFNNAFDKYDFILGPTAPAAAPELGASLSDPLQMYLGDIYTAATNLAGLPAISVPYGLDNQRLPIGIQLTGDCFQEKKIIRGGCAFEQMRGAWELPFQKEVR